MLDKENPTTQEWAIQQLLIQNSKTSLGELNRTMRRLMQSLYKTNARALSLDRVIEAVDIATKLANGDSIENKENHISTETGKK